MPQPRPQPTIPATFTAKKTEILSILGQSENEYSDSSPKGSVDEQIRDLIDEINSYDGLVTTSSCAGRVAVFVEGPKSRHAEPDEAEDGRSEGKSTVTTTVTSPGGKGGGRWLYVSHDHIPTTQRDKPSTGSLDADVGVAGTFTQLFNLSSPAASKSLSERATSPRVIHLSFSPLILHVHCATLQHARPVLAAAINAGFRESGVQSLRIMDDPEHGVMVAVRTAGLAFETAVGVVALGQNPEREIMQSVVSEDYLAMCVGVVNERFAWNVERKERFRTELKRAMGRDGFGQAVNGWEDQEARRVRKREEGLARQKREALEIAASGRSQGDDYDDGELNDGLGALVIE